LFVQIFVLNRNSAHYWQSFIEQLFRGASGGFQTVLKKVDQVVMQTLLGPHRRVSKLISLVPLPAGHSRPVHIWASLQHLVPVGNHSASSHSVLIGDEPATKLNI
jgi:hypothetical protein